VKCQLLKIAGEWASLEKRSENGEGHSSRKRTMAKDVKSYDFFDFEKNVKKRIKNVEVITYMPIVLKTTVTILNQFCFLSHNSKAIIF